jgi:transposase
VSEHRLHRLRCPVCAAETRAELPPGIPSAALGPRLQAAVATLAVRNRVSRCDTAELVGGPFGLELSTGSVDAIVQRTGEAVQEPQARLQKQIRSAPAVNVDETGWRTAGGRRTCPPKRGQSTASFEARAATRRSNVTDTREG